MPDIRLVYTTWPEPELAAKVGQALVAERLAACANILPGALSLFWWRGEVQAEAECVMILKTPQARVEALRARLLDMHPFETPAFSVVALDEDQSSAPFLSWVEDETRASRV